MRPATVAVTHPLIQVAGKVPKWHSDLDTIGRGHLDVLMRDIADHVKAPATKRWKSGADSLMARYWALEAEAGRRFMCGDDASMVNAKPQAARHA